MSNPTYPPEITTKTTLVNFAVKEQGLEAQLLGIVVRHERKELEDQRESLVLKMSEGQKTLLELEDKILHLLNTAQVITKVRTIRIAILMMMYRDRCLITSN